MAVCTWAGPATGAAAGAALIHGRAAIPAAGSGTDGSRGECPCDGDMNGDGIVNILDVLTVYTCSVGGVPPDGFACEPADVNCDGVVDACDASRVFCQVEGGTDCCGLGTVCGACCSDSSFETCEFVSESFCTFLAQGDWLGGGTTCDPMPCECLSDEGCDDGDPCTADTCGPEGVCEHGTVPSGTPCPDDGDPCTADTCGPEGVCEHGNGPDGTPCGDDAFCNGDEVCVEGACAPGEPRNCEDALACTIDSCNEGEDACVHAPIECNHDGVCDAPCESSQTCPDDCGDCPCNVDVNEDGVVNVADVVIVIGCALGDEPPPGNTCDLADVNCDGVVDTCDASRVFCHVEGGTNCCGLGTVCGACCNEHGDFEPCDFVSLDFCTYLVQGRWLGGGTTCAQMPCRCSSDEDCDDSDGCTVDRCDPQDPDAGTDWCVHTHSQRLLGDVLPGFCPPQCPQPDLDDIVCVLDDFVDGTSVAGCTGLEPPGTTDLAPCGGNGVIDVDDILAVLDAFTQVFACPHPCPG